MQLFSKLEKKNKTGAIFSFVFEVEHSSNKKLKSFVFNSVSATDLFLDNFFNKNLPLGFLSEYKSSLNPDSVLEVAKIFALFDLISINKTYEDIVGSSASECSIFKYCREDQVLYKEIKEASENLIFDKFYLFVFNKIFINGLGVKDPLNTQGNQKENIISQEFLKRSMTVSQILNEVM